MVKDFKSIDTDTYRKIASIAWDCTIGSGVDPEERAKPDADAWRWLETELKRVPTDDEKKAFNEEWRSCIQQLQQP